MALEAVSALQVKTPSSDKQLLAFLETDGCFADGVSVGSGCTVGHRTLHVVDQGKVAVTFVNADTGDALRLHPHPLARERAGHYAQNASTPWYAQRDGYQCMPTAELLISERVQLVTPLSEIVGVGEARVICQDCGEEVINQRHVILEGRTYCRACAGDRYVLPAPTINGTQAQPGMAGSL